MANWYVYHAAAGGGTGADWTNAYTTLAAACTAKAAGDTFFVAHNHAETAGAAVTITSPGTEAVPCRILCVNSAGSVPPVSADLRTTATITTTGTFGITLNGSVSECYGITFSAASGGGNANLTIGAVGRLWRFVNCALRCVITGTVTRMVLLGCILENTTVQFGAVAQGLQQSNNSKLIWKNTPSAITGATLPTSLFVTILGTVLVEGVDLSALTSGKALVTHTTSGATMIFKNCKLSSTASIIAGGTSSAVGSDIQLIDCDSGDVHYRNERYNFMGTQTVETTIVLTGGASDGTTPVSWKIVTTADSEKEMPFECLPIYVWNETTGSSKTVTVQGIWGGGAVPNNDDIWIDVYAKTTSGFPITTRYTCGKANTLTTGAALAAGTGTWGGSTTKFAMAVTITPAEKGLITVYVKAALASTTFYIDPKPVIT
jgi:hypothetical protein